MDLSPNSRKWLRSGYNLLQMLLGEAPRYGSGRGAWAAREGGWLNAGASPPGTAARAWSISFASSATTAVGDGHQNLPELICQRPISAFWLLRGAFSPVQSPKGCRAAPQHLASPAWGRALESAWPVRRYSTGGCRSNQPNQSGHHLRGWCKAFGTHPPHSSSVGAVQATLHHCQGSPVPASAWS